MSNEASAASPSSIAKPEVIDLTEDDSDEEGLEQSSNGSEQSSDDSDDTTEVQINRESRSQLYVALSAVPEVQIRQILTQLIEQVPAVEYALTKEFVALTGSKRKPDDSEYDNELCTKCHEEFDAGAERVEDECAFHPGMLKPDMHSFADWDEEVHGPIDADDTRREFPENFLWTCCQEDGVSVGCVNGLHQPANPQKKPRVTDV
ncbi:hypothetical protein BT96DRAFT_548543 [Gymnopus androsaceus JB14]|uniref:C2H2-type domain-containing protein n=1 Tax=Gymnopus androsaceus JB14 TaxID=1447944 RepID=A0A6A4HWD6_9AGAR|nr:hypothetical protein BT96DRAFT_548543 [Gymnopus androsaceus JB14]